MKSYDRSDGETSKAYAAFTIYRNMGASRSLEKTANEFYPRRLPANYPTHPNIARIERWSTTWNWVARCRDFDRDLQESNRALMIEVERERYIAKCDELRVKCEATGFGILNSSLRILAALDRIATKLEDMPDKDINQYTPGELNLILQLPTALKAISGCANNGLQLGADGLGLSDVVQKMTKALEK